jgi:hypothetical protein
MNGHISSNNGGKKMSIDTIMNAITRYEKELTRLEKSMAEELKKEADKRKKISDLERQIRQTKSQSTYKTKANQIQRLENEIAAIIKKKAEINKKVADKRAKLVAENQKLNKEQLNAQKKEKREQEKVRKSYEAKINSLTSQIESSLVVERQNIDSILPETTEDVPEHDVFISHASEDKEEFVRELAETLTNVYGLNVWYDEFSIKWGDSLRNVIDKGLSNSRYGVVVISRNFIKKGWTNYELDGLFQIEMTKGKTILPIWHDITKDEVQKFSPILEGRKALNTAMFTIDEIAQELKTLLD